MKKCEIFYQNIFLLLFYGRWFGKKLFVKKKWIPLVYLSRCDHRWKAYKDYFFQKRLILETLFGKTMRELKWITIFTPYSVRISLIIANILIFKYNLSNIFDNIIPLFNEIHVNAHVRTYKLYSYLPSFGHNDFFFSIQSKRNRYS